MNTWISRAGLIISIPLVAVACGAGPEAGPRGAAQEVAAQEVGAREVGAQEVGAQEVGAREVGAREVGAREAMVRVVVPEGTVFTVELDHALSSRANAPGDPVQARVVKAVRGDEPVVVRPGASARGVVAEVEGAGRVKGRAVLALNFTSLETVAGSRGVHTAMVDGTLKAPGTKKRDVVTVVGGAAAGAVIGEILGDVKLGTIIGAAAGTGVVLATRGKEAKIEPGTRFDLRLVRPLSVEMPRDSRALTD